jgi:DNA (cytosine-5)-methyltransferase 1
MTLRYARYGSPGIGAALTANLDREPAPTVMAGGIGGGNTSQYRIWNDGTDTWHPDMTKPSYRVPSMAEIHAVPWNGLKVASTFAGGGGSSTGYRMAGCKVVYANELTESARDSYAANMAPGTVLDGRDIRTVQAEDILTATGLGVGELDIFDGSPPCVSFSTAGKREAGWGRVTTSHDATQRQDDLFHEFARLLKGLQPRAFVAENVSGLIKGTAKGYFLEILRALRACGYRVEAKLLDAQWLGVPQSRQRLIFVGTRLDLDARPAFPAPLGYRYSVRDALPWISKIEGANGFNQHEYGSVNQPAATMQACRTLKADTRLPPSRVRIYDGQEAYGITIAGKDNPAPTITVGSPGNDLGHPTERRKFTIAELKRICAFPDDYVLTGSYADQWARCGNAVPPVMMFHIASALVPVLIQTERGLSNAA